MPVQVSQELIDDLVRIGTLKNRYPIRERWAFNELGLYVQMRSRRGMTSLKAGGKFISRISLYQPQIGERWEVKKYKPGEWQALVKPTLELAEWLHKYEGVGGPIAELDFWEAIQDFKKSGVLTLSSTDEVEYFGVLSDLKRTFVETTNMIVGKMKLLKEQVQSGHALMFGGLDIGSTKIASECENIEECLRQVEKLKVPERLQLQNSTLLALMRAGIDMGWLARDCHRIHEGKPLGTEGTHLGGIVSRESALRAKTEEYIEVAREYWRLHLEEQNILDQLVKEDEETLKARLAAKG